MRLLLVEDERELGGLIAASLRRAGYTVDHFVSLGEAGFARKSAPYDAILLDLNLPDGEGLDFLRQLRRTCDETPVLLLTARDALSDRISGLDSGADDYIVKPVHMSELVSRIRAVLRRPRTTVGERLALGELEIEPAGRRAKVAGEPLALSRRELGLLEILIRRPGQVVGREAIIDGLYTFDEEIGSNAVEVLVHRVRRKLKGAGADVQIHTLRGLGYILSEDGA